MIGSSGGNFGFDMGALLGNMMKGGYNDGLGGGGGIWAIILIIALLGGFNNGNGGLFGRGNGETTAALDASLQRGFDNQSVINKLNGLENGVCSLGYDQLNQMNGISNTVTQTGNAIQQSLQNLLIALMQQGFTQSTQVQQCCCNIENLLQQANYNRQADTCAITTAINQMGQAIMQNDNANYRQLHDENIAIQMQAKDDRIAQLTAALNRCDNRADNAEQTQQIMSFLNPPTVRAIPGGAFPFWANWNTWGGNCNNCNSCNSCNSCCGNNFVGF